MKFRVLALAVAVAVPAAASAAPQFAVWLDGNTTPGGGGNGIVTSLAQAFGAGSYQLVSTADLSTPGFLNSFSTVIVSRYASNFGTYLPATAVANIKSYVGSGATQGGVAAFTNDAADSLYGATTGDPYDPNVNQLFINAAKFAAASGHGYIGEFNGAIQAFTANGAGAIPLGLLTGTAAATIGVSGQFIFATGPIGNGNAIDQGVSFPFADTETTDFLTRVSGADPNQVVDIYTGNNTINGVPAVIANNYVISGGNPTPSPVPEPTVLSMFAASLAGLGVARRRKRG